MKVKDHPNADKLYILTVATGDREKQIVAGIKKDYTKQELEGQLVILLDNLQTTKIRGVESQGMILAAQHCNTNKISILTVDKPVSIGSLVS